MKVLITGHRRAKLVNYSADWIHAALYETLAEMAENGYVRGYVGMADGVDLLFCQHCNMLSIPYVACVPFDEQDDYMSDSDKWVRKQMIDAAAEVRNVRNSWMLEEADMGIVVWDGNKGGTHDVVQQLIEKKKDFVWLNPVSQVVWKCFK